MKKQNLSLSDQREGTEVAVVPAGGIVGAAEYFENGPRRPLEAPLPVLQGAFKAAEFDFNESTPRMLQHGLMVLGEGMPVLAFTLQSGASKLFWFANIADPEVWAMLEAWDAVCTMVLAMHFDDGRVRLATEPFRMPEQLRALHELAVQRPDFTRAFQDAMAHMYAQTANAPDLVSSELPQHLKLKHVQMSMVVTAHTGPIAVRAEELPLSHFMHPSKHRAPRTSTSLSTVH